MATRKSLKRPKAFFGADGAITAAAIAAQTVSQIAQAAMNRKATMQAAKEQSAAIEQQSQIQSQAMTRANANANSLQRQSQEFISQQNEANRDLQKQNMMNMQMLMGQENSANRREQSKITAKYGSNTRRKLRNAGKSSLSSTGELGFKITDGAEGVNNPVIPLQYTEDGGVIMMVNPNLKDHDERNSSGRKGFGVATASEGMPFIPNKSNLEMEGGEVFKAVPGKGIQSVISKHKLPGTNFNPREYYLATGDYEGAFNEAETIKNIKGISDSGNTKRRLGMTSPVEEMRVLRLNGGGINPIDMVYSAQPDLSGTDMNGYMVAAALNQNNIPDTANAADGQQSNTDVTRTNVMKAKYGTGRVKLKCGGRRKADLGVAGWNSIGAGFNTVGNVAGAAITNRANNRAARIMTGAYRNAADILGNAYDRLTGIDLDSIKLEDYEAAPVLANIRSARYNINPQLERVQRIGRNLAQNVRKNTLSSAAQQSKELAIIDKMDDTSSQLYADQANHTEAIKQGNMQELNRVATENANRMAQARQQFAASRLAGMQYNNDINNEKILGRANAESSAALQIGQTQASTRQANAQGWANALNNVATGWSSAFNNIGNYRANLQSNIMGADDPEVRRTLEMTNDRYSRKLLRRMYPYFNTDKVDLGVRPQSLDDYFNAVALGNPGLNTKGFKVSYN